MVESAREVCGSVKVGVKNPKSVWILRGEVVNEARRNRGSTTIWKGMLDV